MAGGLAIGAIGGALAAWAHVPLAWMLGALFLCMAFSLAGAPIFVPNWFRTFFFGLIGLFLGEGFGGPGAERILDWPLTIAGAVLYVPVGAVLCYWIFRRFAGMSRGTALLCGLPGGLTAAALFAEEVGGDERQVALSQALRVSFVVLMAPAIAFGLLGFSEPGGMMADKALMSGPDFLLLGGLALVLGVTVERLGGPLPHLIGPILASVLLRPTGLVEGGLPGWLVEVALLISGASIGTRFHGVKLAVLGRVAVWTALTSALLMGLSFLFALAFNAAIGVDLFAALLAFAPGGVAEMSLIALAIDADPAFVATHHIARIFAIILSLPLMAVWLKRALAGDGAG
jgi:membrane AbrB-like protein